MADTTTRAHRPTEEVRRDIEHTLSQMDDTVDALADRLSPEHLIDQAWGRLRGGTDEGIGRVVREHPIPVALVGLGLGWLAVEEATGHDSSDGNGSRREIDVHAERRVPIHERYASVHLDEGYESEGIGGSDVRDRTGESTEGGVLERARDRVSEAGERASEMASEAGERAREMKDRASARLSETGSEMRERARRGFWEAIEENPLALGAVAFGVGLASGVSVPSTDVEDRFMGRTSDTLGREARRVGRETTEKAKHVAEDAARAAAHEAEHVVDAAAEAARQRAEAEGLTSEGLKDDARQVRDRTVEQAEEDAERLRQRRSGGSGGPGKSGGSGGPSPTGGRGG